MEQKSQEVEEVALAATELAEKAAAKADANMREMMEEHEQTLLAQNQEMQAAKDESSRNLNAVKSQVAELQHQIQEQKGTTRSRGDSDRSSRNSSDT